MRAWRKNPGWAAVLGLSALVWIGASWCGWAEWRAGRAAQRQSDLSYREWQLLAQMRPQPTAATASGLAAELAQLEKIRTTWWKESLGDDRVYRIFGEAPMPSDRTAAFFDLAAFVERNRARARESGVTIDPDERFGFADYAHTGPPAELIPAVFRQRKIADCLLGALFAAKPRKLIAVRRELPDTAPGESSGAQKDKMTMPPGLSLRAPGLVRTTGFRLRFSGDTATLRAFLNRLRALELPVAVRAVEAEPATMDHGADDAVAAPVPLVARVLTEFTVTLEYFEPAAEPGPRL